MALWAAREPQGALYLFPKRPRYYPDLETFQVWTNGPYLQLPKAWLPDLPPGDVCRVEVRRHSRPWEYS